MEPTREGIYRCCGGYAEHFDWCELGGLEASMRRRRVIFGVVDPDGEHLDWYDREADKACDLADFEVSA